MQKDMQQNVQGLLSRFEQALTDTQKAFDALLKERDANASLRQERDQLRQQLENLRSRADDLAQGNRVVLEHMDSAINRIRKVLNDK